MGTQIGTDEYLYEHAHPYIYKVYPIQVDIFELILVAFVILFLSIVDASKL